MPELKTLLYEKAGRIVTITMNRPERLNATNTQMMEDWEVAWRTFNADDNAWVAIITGAGDRGFCTGQDVKESAETGGPSERTLSSGRKLGNDLKERLWFTPRGMGVQKPIICAVNGVCAGGGLHLVAESDIVIAAEHATFLDPHVAVGQVSALEPIALLQRAPFEPIMRMVLMGREERLTAQRAYEIHLVSEVVPKEQLMPRAREIAEKLCKNSLATMIASKRALWESLNYTFDKAWENGWKILVEHWSHPDYTEGPRAFAERRPPRWQLR
jgi:enoyl-CoA hydratase/carnithine racemase